MSQPYILLGEVARLVGQKAYRINYLLSTGAIPEPALRIGNRRVFTPDDVERVRRAFEERDGRAGAVGE
jgi:DNA-binding transcriptional MerR regulator